MKSFFYLAVLFLTPFSLFGQEIAEHIGISQTNINVQDATTVGQITINPTSAGKIIVHFDGTCISSPGDRIVLAASNTNSWHVNDGNTSSEAFDNDINSNSFSHTRVYDVVAGSQTFYAIAHNYVETDGNGIASIYGSLTVEFHPNSTSTIGYTGINLTNIDLNSQTTVGQVSISPSSAGKVVVHFNGSCISSVGDKIVLAASNTPSWNVNDGNTSVEAVNNDLNSNSFSHTRVYNVNAGSQIFYAVAHNYVETDGNGIASIYGNLTVVFFPNSTSILESTGISKTNIELNDETTVGQLSINPTSSGKVIVHFDGTCISSPGDRIVLAASDTPSWNVNDGNTTVEAINNDFNGNSFSHTRVYNVNAGSQIFYAVAHNYVETDGNGIASIYGTLTVKFIPNEITSNLNIFYEERVNIYPNPTQGFVNISSTEADLTKDVYLRILDNSGKILQIIKGDDLQSEIPYLSTQASGSYQFQLIDEKQNILFNRTIIKMNH